MRIDSILPCIVCLSGVSSAAGNAIPCSQRPIVGAVRWDAWSGENEWEANLAPKQWRHRSPFYSKEISDEKVEVRADTKEVMNQEITYASSAGLAYWAYCFGLQGDLSKGEETCWGHYGVRLHLASKRKADMNLCFILMSQGYWGPKEEYSRAVDIFVKFFQDSAYQKVLAGRPLLYIFYVESMPEYFGSDEAVKDALNLIRSRSVDAGLKPPYIVAMVWDAQTGADCVSKLGFDAISAYAWVGPHQETKEYPYRALADANQAYWEACKATGKKAIPIVSAGWDNRPRWRDPKAYEETYKVSPSGPWFVEPTPQQLADNLRAAIEWNKANPDCAEANAVVIYAWNESDEGGWLVPTKGEGTARLDAIKQVLKP